MAVRTLQELINRSESAWPAIQELARKLPGRCELMPAEKTAGDALVKTQVTTRSPLGALIYHSGGLLVDHRWLRILGSGVEYRFRSLPDWNRRSDFGSLLVADDAVGGFFAIDGGSLGFQQGHVCYWPPDSLDWISLKVGYTQFLTWACTGDFNRFYHDLRWSGWEEDVRKIRLDSSFSFYPFLWTKEGSIMSSSRAIIPISEAFDVKVDLIQQLISSVVGK